MARPQRERAGRGASVPMQRFANVVDVVSDASARQHQLTLGWNIGLPPQAARATSCRSGSCGNASRCTATTSATSGPEQHRRRLHPAARRHAGRSVGTVVARHSVAAHVQLHLAPDPADADLGNRVPAERHAVHGNDWIRHERRRHLQRSAGRCRTEHAARRRPVGAVDVRGLHDFVPQASRPRLPASARRNSPAAPSPTSRPFRTPCDTA